MTNETPTLAAQRRTRTGTRFSRRLRQTQRLPGVIYGHKIDPVHISVDEKSLLRLLHSKVHVMSVELKEGELETCLVRDLQFGWLGDDVIHVDFARVDLDETVTVSVHIHCIGKPTEAEHAGAIVNVIRSEIEVTCQVKHIPSELQADLSTVESIFTIGDLELPEGVVTSLDPERHIAHVGFVEEVEEQGEEEAIVPEAAEPEVITEAKPEEEAKEPSE